MIQFYMLQNTNNASMKDILVTVHFHEKVLSCIYFFNI